MDEKLRFVSRFLDGEKIAALCREFGISRDPVELDACRKFLKVFALIFVKGIDDFHDERVYC